MTVDLLYIMSIQEDPANNTLQKDFKLYNKRSCGWCKRRQPEYWYWPLSCMYCDKITITIGGTPLEYCDQIMRWRVNFG